MSAVLQAFIFNDGEYQGTDVFAERQVVVGRDPAVADLVLESTQVSRRHAIIEHDGKTVKVRDAGSTNGILVNDQPVEQAELGRLDELRIGSFTLKLKIQGGERESAVGKAPARPARSRRKPKTEEERPSETVEASTPKTPVPRKKAPRKSPASRRARRAEESAAVDTEHDQPAAKPVRKKASKKASKKATPRRMSNPPPTPSDDEETRTQTKGREPVAEFRIRDEIMDGDEFGSVLQSIGLTGEQSPVKPSGRSAKKASRRRPAPTQFLDEKPSTATSTDGAPLGVGKVSVPVPSRDPSDDEDYDEDDDFVPPFSLVEQLKSEGVSSDPRHSVVEVLTFKGDSVDAAQLVHRGKSFWIGPKLGFLRRRRARDLPPRTRLLTVSRKGKTQLRLRQDLEGELERQGRTRSLKDVPEVTRHARSRTYSVPFKPGEVAVVRDGAFTYLIRHIIPPPKLLDERSLMEKFRPDRTVARALGGSFGVHIAVLVLVALLVPTAQTRPATLSDEFVEVALDMPELEAPEPEPEPEPPPEPQPEVQKPKKKPPKRKQPKKQKPKAGGTAKPDKPKGVLGLLSKRGLSTAPGPASAVAAVTNIAAVKVPGGTRGFRTSGLQAKLPSGGMQLGGGGGLVTKGGANLLRGGAGGGGRLSGKGSRRVTGLVTKVPRAMRSKGQGKLDRELIQKVVNENAGQIQRCYERELLRTPNLGGKVKFEWVIGSSGKVRSAKQAQSSLNSSTAVTCMLNAIKRWKFPSPKGGDVVVTYPFNFSKVGM